jgi:hypothetical protein
MAVPACSPVITTTTCGGREPMIVGIKYFRFFRAAKQANSVYSPSRLLIPGYAGFQLAA